MASDAERDVALRLLMQIAQEDAMYDYEALTCHCGRVMCRHHEPTKRADRG